MIEGSGGKAHSKPLLIKECHIEDFFRVVIFTAFFNRQNAFQFLNTEFKNTKREKKSDDIVLEFSILFSEN